jgi:transcriptional regulator with XRE-family HTH domain
VTTTKEVGSRLRRLRKDKGLSVRDVAALVAMSHTHVNDIENGKRPLSLTIERLEIWAKALGTSPAAIIEALTSEEQELLDCYRAMNGLFRRSLLNVARGIVRRPARP